MKNNSEEMYAAECLNCEWSYKGDAVWVVRRVADIHRGVYAHTVKEKNECNH